MTNIQESAIMPKTSGKYIIQKKSGVNMNFYDLIARYKFICNKKLDENRFKSNEVTREFNQAKVYLDYLNNKLQISPFVAGCAGVSMLFVAMVTSLFNSLLWIALFVGGVTFSGIGVIQEKKQAEFNKHKEEWFKYYCRLNSELNVVKIEEQNIKAMLNDVITCCNYYMYLVDEASKELPIDIDIKEVMESKCLLSTYLDKFYKGELEEFRQLSISDKKREERTNCINRRLKEVIQSNEGVTEQPRRRRRLERLHGITPEESTTYQTYQRRAL